MTVARKTEILLKSFAASTAEKTSKVVSFPSAMKMRKPTHMSKRPKASKTKVRVRPPGYHQWNAMIQRCHNKKHKSYPRYGGRGIAVCANWRGKGGFANFIEAMGEPPTPSHTIERKNGDTGYTPENCEWADRVEQSRNRPGFNRHIEFRGRVYVAAELAEIFGIPYGTFLSRLDAGWSVEEAAGLLVGRATRRETSRRCAVSHPEWPRRPEQQDIWEQAYQSRAVQSQSRASFRVQEARKRYRELMERHGEDIGADVLPPEVEAEITALCDFLRHAEEFERRFRQGDGALATGRLKMF